MEGLEGGEDERGCRVAWRGRAAWGQHGGQSRGERGSTGTVFMYMCMYMNR